MKELSIEEKAKRYDGLIERLKDLQFAYRFSPLSDTIEEKFPEIKESEDERIKKVVKDFVENYLFWEKKNLTKEKALAWLEKQVDHAKFINSIQVGDKVTRNEDGMLVNLSQLKRIAKKDENQDEQKSFNDTQEYLKGVDRVQNYEELTKFEKGFDRIADTYAHNKNKEGYNSPWYTKERAAEILHWAKEELGLIEKQGEQKPNPVLDIEIPFGANDSELQEAFYYIPEGFHAEIDGDRVVIKRGEQKSATDFSDLRTWKYIVDAVWTEKEGIGQYLDSPFTEEVAKKLQKRFGKIEQKPDNWIQELEDKLANATPKQLAEWKEKYFKEEPAEWSEEDECRMNTLCHFLGTYGKQYYGHLTLQSTISWFKFLKDRVQPQPRQEWSKEDEDLINFVCSVLTNNFNENDTFDDENPCIGAIVDRLKSLKDRYTWKPSNEQIKALETTLYSNMSRNDERYSVLSEFVAELKKLREEQL